MKPLLLLIALFFSVSIYAQEKPTTNRTVAWEQFKAQEGNDWKIRWNEQTGLPRVLTGQSTTKYVGTPEVAAKAFLIDYKELFALKANLSDLRHVQTKENRGVRHVTFQQYFEGVKVEGAQYKVHLRQDGTVDMANGFYYDTIDISVEPAITGRSAIDAAMLDLELATSLPNQNTSELVIYPQEGSVQLAFNVEVFVEEPFTSWQYFIDATNGSIIEAYNKVTSIYPRADTNTKALTKEISKKGNHVFVTGTGKVYPKHPGNSSVTTKSLFGLDGNGKLDGTYVRVKNSSTSDAYSGSHSFQYATTNTHFDETNLYYHVDNFRRNFIEGLDAGNNLFNFIEAFAHNNTVCPSNACYSSGTGDIYFSDNAYEFAKEDKIIHHEYSHKVVRDIESGIQSNGGEEGSISEGTPDYFSGSFTGRSKILEYSVPFAERDMSSPFYGSYSAFQSDNTDGTLVVSHTGGEFFSSILWDIRNNSGITTGEADFLVFDALYRVSGNPDFLEFRDAMLAADNNAYSGSHNNLIQDAFAVKGIGAYSANDATITGSNYLPENTNSTWNVSGSNGTSPFDFTWFRKNGSGSWFQVTTGTSYTGNTGTTTFELKVDITDSGPNVDGEKSYGVAVYDPGGCQICKQVVLPTEFTLSNNYPNPFNPSTQIRFEIPETAEVSIKVYNIVGQQVATLVNGQMRAGFHSATFEADNLASGLYIARLTAVGSSGQQFVSEIKMQLIK